MNKYRVYHKKADNYISHTTTMPLLTLLKSLADNYTLSNLIGLEIHQVIPPKIKDDKSTVKVMGLRIQGDGTLKTI